MPCQLNWCSARNQPFLKWLVCFKTQPLQCLACFKIQPLQWRWHDSFFGSTKWAVGSNRYYNILLLYYFLISELFKIIFIIPGACLSLLDISNSPLLGFIVSCSTAAGHALLYRDDVAWLCVLLYCFLLCLFVYTYDFKSSPHTPN